MVIVIIIVVGVIMITQEQHRELMGLKGVVMKAPIHLIHLIHHTLIVLMVDQQ